MRNADPIAEAVPAARRAAAAVVLLFAGVVLLGWVPLDVHVFGLALVVIGVGLLA